MEQFNLNVTTHFMPEIGQFHWSVTKNKILSVFLSS